LGGWWSGSGWLPEIFWALLRLLRVAAFAGSGPAGGFLFEAGSRPGSRLPFLDSPRKVRSKKATRMSATPSLRCGATCVVAIAGFAVKLSSRYALRSNITASQITKQSCPSAGLQPRNHHAAGADIRGVVTGRRFARPLVEAERSDGAGCWLLAVGCWLLAVGCWLLAIPQPPPFCPRLRWAGCGVAALPKDRAASLSSSP